MLADAYLAATHAQEAKKGPAAGRNGLIPLSSNEISPLLAALTLAPIACVTTTIIWSN